MAVIVVHDLGELDGAVDKMIEAECNDMDNPVRVGTPTVAINVGAIPDQVVLDDKTPAIDIFYGTFCATA